MTTSSTAITIVPVGTARDARIAPIRPTTRCPALPDCRRHPRAGPARPGHPAGRSHRRPRACAQAATTHVVPLAPTPTRALAHFPYRTSPRARPPITKATVAPANRPHQPTASQRRAQGWPRPRQGKARRRAAAWRRRNRQRPRVVTGRATPGIGTPSSTVKAGGTRAARAGRLQHLIPRQAPCALAGSSRNPWVREARRISARVARRRQEAFCAPDRRAPELSVRADE